MSYSVKIDDPHIDLFNRLLKVRKIEDTLQDFLNPSYEQYRGATSHLHDIEKATKRLLEAIENNERIMIFGDYDVDGIMSSYILYTFFRKYLKYDNISIQLPHRQKDGYGIKSYHLDKIKELKCSVVVTVDNGITAVQEAKHARNLGIDLIITDHHHALDTIPDGFAVINPQISKEYDFKEICGATVARKLALHIADSGIITKKEKEQYYHETLPHVGIASVADCMPLIKENRYLVKSALNHMNNNRKGLSKSLQGYLDYLEIKKVDTYHIGFMIAPRLNATGRMDSAMKGLKCLLTTEPKKQKECLDEMEQMNIDRKEMQDEMLDVATKKLELGKHLLIVSDEKYHPGLVGIVAGRITEKYYKPSLVLSINKDKGIATGSLRGPDYFNIVEMLQDSQVLLERFGGHEQAGGITVKLDNLKALEKKLEEYCQKTIGPKTPKKIIQVDTILYNSEIKNNLIQDIEKFGPYGIGNEQPVFVIKDSLLEQVEIIGKKERKHLKLRFAIGNNEYSVMLRGAGEDRGKYVTGIQYDTIGTIKKDDWKGGRYMDGKLVLDS